MRITDKTAKRLNSLRKLCHGSVKRIGIMPMRVDQIPQDDGAIHA
jgi:hypothetical protein